jgi:hypothetical protein
VEQLAQRAYESHVDSSSEEAEQLRRTVLARAKDLMDEWSRIAQELKDASGGLQYQKEEGNAQRLLYEFLSPELATLPPRHKKFRANRSMRDVEPSVNLWLKTIDGVELENEEVEA